MGEDTDDREAKEAAWLKLYENEGTPLDEAVPLSELGGEVTAEHFLAGWEAATARAEARERELEAALAGLLAVIDAEAFVYEPLNRAAARARAVLPVPVEGACVHRNRTGDATGHWRCDHCGVEGWGAEVFDGKPCPEHRWMGRVAGTRSPCPRCPVEGEADR